MKNKMKTSKIILVVLSLCLIMPFVSALSTIQDFLADMNANPSNYYIWHNRIEPEIVSEIENFANQFGVQVSNTEIPGRDFVLITASDNPFGYDYVMEGPTSYARTEPKEEKNYLSIYITVDEGYSGATTYQGAIYDYLNVILDYLLTYQTWPTDKWIIKAAEGQVIEEEIPPTCEEFGDNDNTIWIKDEYLHQGEVWEDFCVNNILSELTCIDNYVNYKLWTCPRGCSDGRCISSIFNLFEEYNAADISYSNFALGIDAWFDVDI